MNELKHELEKELDPELELEDMKPTIVSCSLIHDATNIFDSLLNHGRVS